MLEVAGLAAMVLGASLDPISLLAAVLIGLLVRPWKLQWMAGTWQDAPWPKTITEFWLAGAAIAWMSFAVRWAASYL